ncbi:MAG: hypothetical protein ACQERN_12255 [Thermodesulfobacteriota bacterium]
MEPEDHSKGLTGDSWVTEWRQQGAKAANEFQPAEGHVITAGMELEQCYDGYEDEGGPDEKRIENIAGFCRHEGSIIDGLILTAGLRYKDDTIWVGNDDDGSTGT